MEDEMSIGPLGCIHLDPKNDKRLVSGKKLGAEKKLSIHQTDPKFEFFLEWPPTTFICMLRRARCDFLTMTTFRVTILSIREAFIDGNENATSNTKPFL